MRRISLPILLIVAAAAFTAAWEPKSDAVARGEKTLELDEANLTESSGLAFSLRNEDCFWSHNDSGGNPWLYAFDRKGKACGRMTLGGARADDWEDMASYFDEVPRLLIADVGDNQSRRSSVSLYLLDEPNPETQSEIDSYQHLVVRYADGSRDCEAVAVDLASRKILLLSKTPWIASLYEVPLPDRSAEDGVVRIEVTARPIAKVAIPMATGMDICRNTGDLWVTGYFQAHRFRRSRAGSIRELVRMLPDQLELAELKLRQIEAIAVDDEGKVWVTSEGKPTKMRRVTWEDESDSR